MENDELKDRPIVVGAITPDGIKSSDQIDYHGDLDPNMFHPKFMTRRIGIHWRYHPQTEVLYWWEKVGDEVQRSDAEYHLLKKYGYKVKQHIKLNFREGDAEDFKRYSQHYDTAHGNKSIRKEFKKMKSLKELLAEGVVEKAAEDFIKQTIKDTEWDGKVFIAGGYVRDELLGKDPKDLDLLVNKPNGGIEFANWLTQKIGAYKEGSNPVTYPRFGTAKFNLKGVAHNGQDLSTMDIEAVMPRKEQYTAGSRKPDVTAGDLADDVSRRDFTVNSLLKDLSTGEVLDLTGMGKEDLKKGIVRTPLSPDKIFTDDPLRMLRAVRFAVKYGWKLPMFMIRGLAKNADKLRSISKERIRDELDKMLMTSSPAKAVKLLKVAGLLKHVIPELIPAVKMIQNVHHSKDVFGHTLDVLSKTNPVLVQRLTGLFHDIGKVVTRSVTPTGVHFYGHEMEGAKMVQDIMARLKYPKELIDAVVLGVRHHMRLKQGGDTAVNLSDKALRKFKIEMGDHLENVLDVIHADNLSHAPGSEMPNQVNHIRKRLEALNMNVAQGKPKLPITGFDLQKELGLKPGPIYSDIMKAVTEGWYENPNISREQALEIARKVVKI
jgi:poly(A) polymerase